MPSGRTAEEMQEIGKNTRFNGKMAVEANKKARAARKANTARKETLRETLEILLEQKDESGLTNQQKITLALLNQAQEGNVKAYEVLRDTIGQKPLERIAASVDVLAGEKTKLDDLVTEIGADNGEP